MNYIIQIMKYAFLPIISKIMSIVIQIMEIIRKHI